MGAVETFSAGEGKGGYNQVAEFEVLDRGAESVHVAGEFMAHDEVCWGGLVAAVHVQFTGVWG